MYASPLHSLRPRWKGFLRRLADNATVCQTACSSRISAMLNMASQQGRRERGPRGRTVGEGMWWGDERRERGWQPLSASLYWPRYQPMPYRSKKLVIIVREFA